MKVHIGNLRLAPSLLMLFTFKQTKATTQCYYRHRNEWKRNFELEQ